MLDVDTEGLDRVGRHIGEASRDTGDLRPVWGKTVERWSDIHKKQFDTEGGLTGGWPPLDPAYRDRKRRTRGLRESIMQRTGRLMRTMVNPFDRSEGAVLRMGKDHLEMGTSVEYAAAHQEGRGPLPRRRVLVWRGRDSEWLVERLGEHATRALE